MADMREWMSCHMEVDHMDKKDPTWWMVDGDESVDGLPLVGGDNPWMADDGRKEREKVTPKKKEKGEISQRMEGSSVGHEGPTERGVQKMKEHTGSGKNEKKGRYD